MSTTAEQNKFCRSLESGGVDTFSKTFSCKFPPLKVTEKQTFKATRKCSFHIPYTFNVASIKAVRILLGTVLVAMLNRLVQARRPFAYNYLVSIKKVDC